MGVDVGEGVGACVGARLYNQWRFLDFGAGDSSHVHFMSRSWSYWQL